MMTKLDSQPRAESGPDREGGDLVKRGRKIFDRGLPEDVRQFGREAADEIERLRAERKDQASKLWAANEDCAGQEERAEAAEAREGKLREALAKLVAHHASFMDHVGHDGKNAQCLVEARQALQDKSND